MEASPLSLECLLELGEKVGGDRASQHAHAPPSDLTLGVKELGDAGNFLLEILGTRATSGRFDYCAENKLVKAF